MNTLHGGPGYASVIQQLQNFITSKLENIFQSLLQTMVFPRDKTITFCLNYKYLQHKEASWNSDEMLVRISYEP